MGRHHAARSITEIAARCNICFTPVARAYFERIATPQNLESRDL